MRESSEYAKKYELTEYAVTYELEVEEPEDIWIKLQVTMLLGSEWEMWDPKILDFSPSWISKEEIDKIVNLNTAMIAKECMEKAMEIRTEELNSKEVEDECDSKYKEHKYALYA